MLKDKRKKLKVTISIILLSCSLILSTLPVASATPDTLVLLHPHSADFANHVINDFKDWYDETFGTSITLQTMEMDSGASYQQVKTWDGAPEADVLWGGGEYYLMSLAGKGLLEGHKVTEDSDILDEFGGWPIKDPEGAYDWYAAALSSFGFMWNTEYLVANDLIPPSTWEDLTKPEYYGHIVMCDPAKSGSTTAIVINVIQHYIVQEGWDNNATGWQNAWHYWAKVAGNVGLFTESSHAVPTKVVTGEYGIGLVIDYYSWEQIQAGEDLGWSNGGATTVSTDPAGILKGAPHLLEAQRWMDYLTSKRGQEAVGFGRMPIREDALPTAPVLSAWYNASQVPVITGYDRDAHNAMFSVAREMFSYWLVKNQNTAKASWGKIIEAEEMLLDDDAEYLTAVEEYIKIPESTDTLTKALSVNREEEAAVWETWGASHFEAAKASAQNALSDYEKKSQQAAQSRIYTYVGAGIVIIAVAALLYYYMRKK